MSSLITESFAILSIGTNQLTCFCRVSKIGNDNKNNKNQLGGHLPRSYVCGWYVSKQDNNSQFSFMPKVNMLSRGV